VENAGGIEKEEPETYTRTASMVAPGGGCGFVNSKGKYTGSVPTGLDGLTGSTALMKSALSLGPAAFCGFVHKSIGEKGMATSAHWKYDTATTGVGLASRTREARTTQTQAGRAAERRGAISPFRGNDECKGTRFGCDRKYALRKEKKSKRIFFL
jgi:hypothetical protein